jgi:hypothetical protein
MQGKYFSNRLSSADEFQPNITSFKINKKDGSSSICKQFQKSFVDEQKQMQEKLKDSLKFKNEQISQ